MKNSLLVMGRGTYINSILRSRLLEQGYGINSVCSITEGIQETMNKKYNLIIYGLSLADKQGEVILRRICKHKNVPVLIVSDNEDMFTKITYLRLGAEDYITVPFHNDEVIARIEVILRRGLYSSGNLESIQIKDIQMHIANQVVMINNQEIILTAKEFQILKLLMSYPEKIFSKANLYESIWNEPLEDDRILKTHMSNLRNKLKQYNENTQYIQTIRNIGFRMSKL